MPRTAVVSVEKIFEVLKDMPIFHKNGQLKRKKDPIWKEAVKYMPETNSHNLYFYVLQNRKDIKTNLLKYMNIIPITTQLNTKKSKLKKKAVSKNDSLDDYSYFKMLDNKNEEYLESNELTVLTEMRNSDLYNNIIHKISISPLSVYYWYPQQIALWTDLINIESTLSFIVLDNIIADYTCSETLENSKVFLYALVVKLKKSVILVGQMISNSVVTSEIECFFNTWLQNKAPAPLELIIDYSYNLLSAASLAFNFCTFNEYNIRCFKYLKSELDTLPSTLIRIDIIGLINIIDKWASFDNISQSLKDLYLRGIMYISTIDNLDEFEETVISILALCQSPNKTTELETRRLKLWEYLTNDIIQAMNQSFINYQTGKKGVRNYASLTQIIAIDTVDYCNDIYSYIEQLKKRVINICDFINSEEKISNEYYCPLIVDNLTNLLIDFPSWTNIIFKKDNCSSLVSMCSTKLTCLFKYLKEPLNLSNFVIYHLEKIKVTTKEGLTYISNLKRRNAFQINENLIQTISKIQNNYNNDTHVTISNQEQTLESRTVDVDDIKNTVQSTFQSLFDFDRTMEIMLNSYISSDQEKLLCKILLDTCTETKTFEKFLAIIAQRFCSSNKTFAISFKNMFIDCYNTAELLNKSELKSSSKLFAQLLISGSISWTILTILRLNENTSTAKKNFIRILLCELRQHMGIQFKEKFQNISFRANLKGLFPTHGIKEINFTNAFYRSIGLSFLTKTVNKKERTVNEPSTLTRSSSNSSISSSSSCEFALEIKVRKKRDGNDLSIEE